MVMVLSIGFIISVVALHSKFDPLLGGRRKDAESLTTTCHAVIAKITKRFSS